MTLGLAGAGLAIALLVSVLSESRSVFWFVIFGWSGISATFCPTMILSLFWSRLTANGAVTGMIVGFVGVPIFKFVVPNLPGIGPFCAALGELPPAFACSFVGAVLVSLSGQPPPETVLNALKEEA